MAKQKADPESLALGALASALSDPRPKALFSKTHGFFASNTQATRPAACLCEERGWLEATGEWESIGKSKQQKFRVTPLGIQVALERNEASKILHGITGTLQEMTGTFQQLGQSLKETLATVGQQLSALSGLVDAIAKRVKVPSIDEIVQKLNDQSPRVESQHPTNEQSPPSTSPLSDLIREEIVRMVAAQHDRDRNTTLNLPQIFKALKLQNPTVTLGQFHDSLRELRDQGRIRLKPYTRALASIDDPRNALFLDGEVMYYVALP